MPDIRTQLEAAAVSLALADASVLDYVPASFDPTRHVEHPIARSVLEHALAARKAGAFRAEPRKFEALVLIATKTAGHRPGKLLRYVREARCRPRLDDPFARLMGVTLEAA